VVADQSARGAGNIRGKPRRRARSSGCAAARRLRVEELTPPWDSAGVFEPRSLPSLLPPGRRRPEDRCPCMLACQPRTIASLDVSAPRVATTCRSLHEASAAKQAGWPEHALPGGHQRARGVRRPDVTDDPEQTVVRLRLHRRAIAEVAGAGIERVRLGAVALPTAIEEVRRILVEHADRVCTESHVACRPSAPVREPAPDAAR